MKLYPYVVCFLSVLNHSLAAHESPPPADPSEVKSLEKLVVTGKAESLVGTATSASKGQASAEELANRPLLRRGELLEVVPGVTITQHSGDGKANQYFVRGFNLDHGTDFNITMDGQPVNFVTHAHGQGYADLNPIIPELVERIDYWKGPFFGQLGDLSTAGAAKFRFFDVLPQGIASLTLGQNRFMRGVLADTLMFTPSGTAGERSGLTYGLEYNEYDGPWEREGNSQRLNGTLKWFKESGRDRWSVTAMGYDAEWDSTDQIPRRLVASGGINRLGNIDNSVGGTSSRYSLMAEWDRDQANGKLHADFYLGRYELDLLSNFTYFLNDPINGDQFEQQDGRYFMGGEVRREWNLGAKDSFILGLQTRHDLMGDLGLYQTKDAVRLDTVRVDDVRQSSVGLFSTGVFHLRDGFRVEPGLRADGFYFDVDSDNPLNSGTEAAGIISPKLNFVFGPWDKTEVYVNSGMGFHSNDARGATIQIDPVSGAQVDSVDPLVRTYGFELGTRTEKFKDIVSSLALFYLHSDSELLYVGDAGTSEAGPATERYGVEWTTYWRPKDWMMIDHEMTLSEGRLVGMGGADEIPGSVPFIVNTGITLGRAEGLFGSLRSRFFSPRPLTEDGAFESRQNWQVNGRIGYRKGDWEVALDCLNLLGRDDNDIEYFYESQLLGEAAPVGDIHFHPAEPRTFRLSVTRRF